MLKIFYFLNILGLLAASIGYNLNQLTNGVWLSGAAYCGKENYKTMQLVGPVTGFEYVNTLYDPKTDIQGFIGILPSDKTIHVVLRGSSSVMNWLDDFEIKLVNYETFPECECNVHYGFYRSALNIRNETINIVKDLTKIYPYYPIYINGHSYGSSVGHLLALELVKEGIESQVYGYGQPRTGDKQFASFTNNKLKGYWRSVHNKDIVPHVPPTKVFDYYHSCGEIFEDEFGALHTCSQLVCEDPECSAQYPLYKTNISDHSYYLDHKVSCENSTGFAL